MGTKSLQVSPPSSAEVKERVEPNLHSLSGPLWPVPGWMFCILLDWIFVNKTQEGTPRIRRVTCLVRPWMDLQWNGWLVKGENPSIHAMKTYRKRGMAPSILILIIKWKWAVILTLWSFYSSGKKKKKKRVPDTHLVGLRGGMNFSEKISISAPAAIRTKDRPARSIVTVLITACKIYCRSRNYYELLAGKDVEGNCDDQLLL